MLPRIAGPENLLTSPRAANRGGDLYQHTSDQKQIEELDLQCSHPLLNKRENGTTAESTCKFAVNW